MYRVDKWMVGVVATLGLVAMAAVALCAGPMPEVDPKEAGETLMGGISTGAWVLIIAGGGLLVVWLLRLVLIPNLAGKALAWASTILIGAAGAFAPLAHNPKAWLEAIFAGVAAGLAAGKAWDLLPEKAKAKAKAPIKARQK